MGNGFIVFQVRVNHVENSFTVFNMLMRTAFQYLHENTSVYLHRKTAVLGATKSLCLQYVIKTQKLIALCNYFSQPVKLEKNPLS